MLQKNRLLATEHTEVTEKHFLATEDTEVTEIFFSLSAL